MAHPDIRHWLEEVEQDILESYKLHASGYIKKPITLEGFRQTIAELEEYWFMICKRVSKDNSLCLKS